MKANFSVDPDFPVIDGIGHSDKIDFFDVKGGGCTNTTLLDPLDDNLHCHFCCRSVLSPVSTTVTSFRADPDLEFDNQVPVSFWQAGSPGCLNAPYLGDTATSRGSDRILLNRIEVSGVVHRPSGTEEDDYSSIAPAPKCFVALVLDTQCDGAVPPDATYSAVPQQSCGPFSGGGSLNPTATNGYGSVPFLSYGMSKRYRVLAFDVIDFALNPETRYEWVDYANTTATTGGPLPAPTETTIVTRTRYSFWRDVSIGFRFDVALNDALCCFSGSGHSVASLVDSALHIYALCFDGVNLDNYVPHGFGTLSLKYKSRLWFSDYLVPRSDVVAPGADGDVVPDDEVPLAILADQSAAMAGDGIYIEAAERDRGPKRRHTKASTGHFNFRPKFDAPDFDDDPEFSSARRGLRKYESRSRAPNIVQRRFKANKYDDNEDFLAREGDRGGKRGKY